MMRTSHLLIQPLYLQPHKYKDQSLELVPNNLTIRNDGPSMDEEDKHWSMITHGGDGSKHLRIEDDATSTESANVDPDKMTNAEMHAHFLHLLGGHATDVDGCLGDVDAKLTDALDKIEGLEAAFNSKLDAKFQELLTRLPPPRANVQRRARRVPAGRTSSWTTRQSAPQPRGYTSTFYLQVHRACITSTTGCYFTTICWSSSEFIFDGLHGKTRDIQCRKCLGFGHIERECRTKRVILVREDGKYDSASDFDEDTLALIAARDGANSDSEREMEVMEADTADQYRSLVAQHVLSVQLSKAEHDQRHNLFQTRGIVKERAIRIIIDGGSCNNLASVDMVEKLSLPTRQRTHPYYIQWFESSRKLKEFIDVFPQDVPPGLPPIRGIEHQIDLIPAPARPGCRPSTSTSPASSSDEEFGDGKTGDLLDPVRDAVALNLVEEEVEEERAAHAAVDAELEQRRLAAAAAVEDSDSDISWSSDDPDAPTRRRGGGERAIVESFKTLKDDAANARLEQALCEDAAAHRAIAAPGGGGEAGEGPTQRRGWPVRKQVV
ncbi:hypothetical protein QYE76_043180 [Lolium multiflorum]|uniref:CCHC-type domain-containing protein n=1 Tax=Lolium multiflorum TaxID=4521 RepID=A0AAD8TI86_LOLMU|nr:hypothetical protein QYE76_043180 [Lolium multiflorum]